MKQHKNYFYLVILLTISEIRDNAHFLGSIINSLQRYGYKCQSPVQILGKSGVTHSFDMGIDKGDHQGYIVADVVSSSKEVDEAVVLSSYSKYYDVEASKLMLFVQPRLSKFARRLTQEYRISVIDAERINGAIDETIVASICVDNNIEKKVIEKETVSSPFRSAWTSIYDQGALNRVLLLYENNADIYNSLLPFFDYATKDCKHCQFFTDTRCQPCIYAYDEKSENRAKLMGILNRNPVLMKKVKLNPILNTDDDIQALRDTIVDSKCPKSPSSSGIAINIGNLHARFEYYEFIVSFRSFLEEIKYQSERPLSDKHKINTLNCVTAVNIESASYMELKEFMALHNGVALLGKNYQTFMLLGHNNNAAKDIIVDYLPRQLLKDLVKNNLQTLVLQILERQPMCGYDIIKTLHNHYGTFVSAGTLYPLLYNLAKKQILVAQRQDSVRNVSRSMIVYHLTDNGSNYAEQRITEFTLVLNRMLHDLKPLSKNNIAKYL